MRSLPRRPIVSNIKDEDIDDVFVLEEFVDYLSNLLEVSKGNALTISFHNFFVYLRLKYGSLVERNCHKIIGIWKCNILWILRHAVFKEKIFNLFAYRRTKRGKQRFTIDVVSARALLEFLRQYVQTLKKMR